MLYCCTFLTPSLCLLDGRAVTPPKIYQRILNSDCFALTEKKNTARSVGLLLLHFGTLSLLLQLQNSEPLPKLTRKVDSLSASSLASAGSMSSRQSMQHGGAPELMLGLAYNESTGRLSVEVVKGSNFKNLATSKAPGVLFYTILF